MTTNREIDTEKLDKAMDKVFEEYGETLRLLGSESEGDR